MNPLSGSVSCGEAKSTRQVVVSWPAGIPWPMVTPSNACATKTPLPSVSRNATAAEPPLDVFSFPAVKLAGVPLGPTQSWK